MEWKKEEIKFVMSFDTRILFLVFQLQLTNNNNNSEMLVVAIILIAVSHTDW